MKDVSITLVNESCFSFLKELESNSIDLALIDPPYEVSRETNFKSGEAKGKDTDRFRVSMDFGDWDSDFTGLDEVIKELYRVLRKGGTIICFYDIWKISILRRYFDDAKYLRDAIEHAPEELKPFTAGIYLRYGLSEKQIRPDNERALQCFKKALQLNENYYPAIFQIACLCAIDKKYTEAKIRFRKVAFLIQGNYNHRDWRDFSLEEILYVFRCYIWLAKLALIEGGESSIGVSIALAKNTAIVFTKTPILEKCCDIEHYGKAKNYHQGSITVRAVLAVLRDMAGDSKINMDLQEEIDDLIRICKKVSDAG